MTCRGVPLIHGADERITAADIELAAASIRLARRMLG